MVNFFCFEATAACFLCSDPKQLYRQCLAWLYGEAVRCQECSSLLQLIRSGGIVLYRTGAPPLGRVENRKSWKITKLQVDPIDAHKNKTICMI